MVDVIEARSAMRGVVRRGDAPLDQACEELAGAVARHSWTGGVSGG